MSSNLDVLNELAAFEKVTRDIDLGEYSEKYKGRILTCWVNAPAVLDSMLTRYLELDENRERQNYNDCRAALSVMLELPRETVNRLDDRLMLWLFNKCMELYREYGDFLAINGKDSSEPGVTPSTSPA